MNELFAKILHDLQLKRSQKSVELQFYKHSSHAPHLISMDLIQEAEMDIRSLALLHDRRFKNYTTFHQTAMNSMEEAV